MAEVGDRFGRLVLLELVKRPQRGRYFRCACDCGGTTIAYAGHLNRGERVSCGCQMRVTKTKHGLSRSAEYKAWDNARHRCLRPQNIKYRLYGARGIAMCAKWVHSFASFIDDMGLKPTAAHSLERKDGNKGYEPTNCVWATAEEQNNNRPGYNRRLVVDGHEMTVAQASRKCGLPHATILSRLNAGKSDAEAICG